MLYPQPSETRERMDLNGIWRFRIDPGEQGVHEGWYAAPLRDTIDMPVPASFNDVTVDAQIRDHVGVVWYERTFFVPAGWQGRDLLLRFGAVCHHATVYVNGQRVTEHKGGFLPFEVCVTSRLHYGAENRLTVAVDNRLDWQCLPVGELKPGKGYARQMQVTDFDFFNYSGLHRPVLLQALPKTRVEDVTVTTGWDGKDGGHVAYRCRVTESTAPVRVRLLDREGIEVAAGTGATGALAVSSVTLWEPGRAYLYTLVIEVLDAAGDMADCYRLPVGIRTVEVRGDEFLINGKPFYFRGFGRHEDSDLLGRGLSDAVNIRDFNLLEWIGANSFRTSHYPYSEEMMRMADERGIVIIDEVPAVGMNRFSENFRVFVDERVNEATRAYHQQTLEELIARDKNHACVVMWSVANEAATYEPAAEAYFQPLFARVRELDPTRPVTIVEAPHKEASYASGFADVVCINKYESWYWDYGRLDLIEEQLEASLRGLYERFGKPVIIAEFGADTIPGMHCEPPIMFTEEYQRDFIRHFCAVFDRLPFVIGEHIWNFADFATKQGLTRVMGNKKGVFTRQRQPKSVAYDLRARWRSCGG